MTANEILDQVEAWAWPRWMLIRETIAMVAGRIDGLLIPCSFETLAPSDREQKSLEWTQRMNILGVEVKASKADFLAGLRRDQFAGYAKDLSGLFIATNGDVRTKEIPRPFGHLRASFYRCVCPRMPQIARHAPMTEDLCWRTVMKMQHAFNRKLEAERMRIGLAMKTLGHRMERLISDFPSQRPTKNA